MTKSNIHIENQEIRQADTEIPISNREIHSDQNVKNTDNQDLGTIWDIFYQKSTLTLEALTFQSNKMDTQIEILGVMGNAVAGIDHKLAELNNLINKAQKEAASNYFDCTCAPIINKLATIPEVVNTIFKDVKDIVCKKHEDQKEEMCHLDKNLIASAEEGKMEQIGDSNVLIKISSEIMQSTKQEINKLKSKEILLDFPVKLNKEGEENEDLVAFEITKRQRKKLRKARNKAKNENALKIHSKLETPTDMTKEGKQQRKISIGKQDGDLSGSQSAKLLEKNEKYYDIFSKPRKHLVDQKPLLRNTIILTDNIDRLTGISELKGMKAQDKEEIYSLKGNGCVIKKESICDIQSDPIKNMGSLPPLESKIPLTSQNVEQRYIGPVVKRIIHQDHNNPPRLGWNPTQQKDNLVVQKQWTEETKINPMISNE